MTLLFSVTKVLFEIARVARAGFFLFLFLLDLKDKWSMQVTFETVWVVIALKSKSRQSQA